MRPEDGLSRFRVDKSFFPTHCPTTMLANIASRTLQVEQFQSRLKDVCGLFHAQPYKGQEIIHGQVSIENRSGIDMAHVATDLKKVERTLHDCRQDDGENFFLVIQEEGRSLMSQNNTAQMMHPGDMILIDSAKPSEFDFYGTFGRQLSLHLPRTEMRERFGENIRSGLFIQRNDHAAVALTAILSKVFSTDGTDAQDVYLKESMFGLIGVMLHEKEGRNRFKEIEADFSGAQMLKNGIAHIDRNFTDCDLSIQQIAIDLNMSMRQLQRGFALVGTTPTDYLVQKRMERACQLLLARKNNGNDMLVSAIAYSCGFNDISYFNRQFRKSFGCAPGQYGDKLI